jgi:hypothetical protein
LVVDVDALQTERKMMHDAKNWLLAALVVATLGGVGVAVTNIVPSPTAAAEPKGDEWRNHDGHWSFWHAGDKRWYYTDGVHWYYHSGLGWVLYPFDKLFGREFHHGDYKVPPAGAEIVLPRHGVHR